MSYRLSFAVLALALLLPFAAIAQDSDQDGVPDAVEEQLGTDPNFAEPLDVLATDRTRDQGDSVGKDNYAPGLDMTAIALGSAGRGRWLWRVDFLAEPIIDNMGLIIYIQADNDETTGRQDIRGIDYMLTAGSHGAGVRAFTPDGSESRLPARAAAVGKSLFICADLDLNQEAGRTRCSANVLIETREPYKMVDNLSSFTIDIPGEADREPIKLVSDATESEHIAVTWGLDLQREARKNPGNIVLPIQDCVTHGFQYDNFTEYHMPSVRVLEGEPYTIEATVPRAGRYHPAFIAYDDAGLQVYTLALNGKRLGIAVAGTDNNRQAFFIADDPVDVGEGDVLTVELVRREGNPRVEDLFLLAEMPEIRPLLREFRHIDVREGWVTFVTTWPVKAKLEYGATAEYGEVVEDTEAESNHRLLAPVLPPNPCHYRISAETPEGDVIVETGVVPAERGGRGFLTPDRRTVPLTITNPHAVSLSDWPITQGIPFPEGEMAWASPLQLRILDPLGQPIPIQTDALALWPDGSIKWLLLDFQVDLPASDKATYTVEYGAQVPAAPNPVSPIKLSRGEGMSRIIDTGALKLELSTDTPGAVAGIWLDKNGDAQYSEDERVAGGDFALGSDVEFDDDRAGTDARPFEIRRISNGLGAMRAAFRVSRKVTFPNSDAEFLDEYEYHLYAGKPFIRVFHTWTNSNPKSEWSDIQAWDLVNTLNLGDGLSATTNGVTVDGAALRAGLSLDQPFDNVFSLTAGGEKLKEGDRASGWIDLSGSKAGATVAVRNFWQLYPKRLSAGVDAQGRPRITVGIMPEFAPGTYQVSKEGELEDKLYYYLKDDLYHLRQGMSKRHELLYHFRPGGENPDEALAVATAFQQPPLAIAPPDWYCDSGALTDVLRSDPDLGGIYRAYDEATRNSLDAYLDSRERGREYGMLNFGDWWGERGRNWGNIEYDTQHSFYLQFMRSADPRFFYAGEEACRHNMDVDMVRAHKDPYRVGCVYSHCIGHTGGYYDHMINDQGSPNGGFSITHSWADGYLDNYFLTGDVRGMESAKLLLDHYDSYYLRNYDYNNNRTTGWHLIATLTMYRATGDPYYLNAAHIIMERCKEREMPEGGWTRQLMPGHCLCLPRHRGEAAFMTGINLTGLKDYHEITGDAAVAAMIVRGAKNIIEETWVPQTNGMRYTSCPNSGAGTGLSTLVTEGILYAFGISGDPEIGEVALAGTLQAGTRVTGFGKSLSQQTRVTPHFLHQLRELKLTETAVELGDQPLVAYVKPRPGTPFEIVLRPREGAGPGRATLTSPQGRSLASVELDPGLRAVTLISGTAPEQGVYRLELTGSGPWGIDPYLNPLVIEAETPVVLAPQPCSRAFFVAPGTTVTCAEAGAAETVTDTYGAPLESAGRLRYHVVPADLKATVTLSGPSKVFAPWSQFWFDPGQPTASLDVDWEGGPGKPITLTLDATGSTDPDGRIVRAVWTVDDKPAGEGMTLDVPLEEGGSHTISLRVVDDSDLEAVASTTVRVPPTWLTSLAPDRSIVIQAEDFSGQTGGEVKLYERYSEGQMLTYWHASIGHTLTWTVDVPVSGRYMAVLKYCTDTPNTRRDFKVDGAPPVDGLKEFHLPSTGGFSTGVDNWEYLRLGEWTGKPFTFDLAAGTHQLSMTNLGDGCALDLLLLVRVSD